ncbi:MAG: FkbM family methyltransferase [Bacteroidales bacterium]
MKIIRIILLQIVGLRRYLQLVSKLYICCISHGCWKKKYPELFFLDTVISKGNTCIDIGANLGYYSARMADLVGETGHVYAVEPIPLFGEIWKKNIQPHKKKHVQLLPYALGEEDSIVQMGMPEKNGRLHHGMTKIASIAQEKYVHFFNVEMRNPDALFADLSELHFIKCDVEGYESVVFENMTQTITQFRPLVQSELSGVENRHKVINLFHNMNYDCAVLRNNSLEIIPESEAMTLSQDFYFIPQ